MMDRFVYSCVVCWLVVCSCCPSITIIIIIIVKRHGHEMRRQRRHTHLLNICTYVCNIYYTTVSLWLSVCRSVLYMLKLCATTIGPETNLYKHFTEWKPHKKDEEKRMKKKTGSPLKRIYLYFAKENCFRFLNLSFACGMRHAQVRQRVELS